MAWNFRRNGRKNEKAISAIWLPNHRRKNNYSSRRSRSCAIYFWGIHSREVPPEDCREHDSEENSISWRFLKMEPEHGEPRPCKWNLLWQWKIPAYHYRSPISLGRKNPPEESANLLHGSRFAKMCNEDDAENAYIGGLKPNNGFAANVECGQSLSQKRNCLMLLQ